MFKLYFNEPFPHSQRDLIIKSFRNLGLSYERIYQPGPYSLHRFYGRLPCSRSPSNISINFSDEKTKDAFEYSGLSDYIEIFVNIERE